MIKQLREIYGLDIEAPFSLQIEGEIHTFQCLLRGYGAKNGMVIDDKWANIEPVANSLIEMGYGFSCIDINEDSIDGFQEVLDDWGRNEA